MSFGRDLEKFASKTGVDMDDVVHAFALDLFSSVIQGTPVDTGRARANWVVTEGQPNRSEIQENDKDGSRTIGKAQREIESHGAGGVIWIANNLPYIRALEFGHSKQFPQGMVRLAIAEAEGKLRAAAGAV